MSDPKITQGQSQANEGEGNRTAARRYNRDSKEFIDSGKVAESADKAAKAVTGSERAELQRAEKAGKSKARH